jgi:hypothetical protein
VNIAEKRPPSHWRPQILGTREADGDDALVAVYIAFFAAYRGASNSIGLPKRAVTWATRENG